MAMQTSQTFDAPSPAAQEAVGRRFVTFLLIAVAFSLICTFHFPHRSSSDLASVWLAGSQLAEGHPDRVYAKDEGVFTMLPPEGWAETAASQGLSGDVFPFLYPPLWAALSGRLQSVATFGEVALVAYFLNPILMACCVALSCRIAAPRLNPALWAGSGVLFLSLTTFGLVAIGQNQPQVMVACLTLLAIERSERGAPAAAGAALAAAAALKGFPAAIAIVWLISGDRKAALWFAAFGAGLAGLSVALAGWSLHESFLHASGLVARTGFMTNVSYSIDALFGNTVLQDRAVFIQSPFRDPSLGERSGWYLYAKPGPMIALGLALQVAVVVWLGRALKGSHRPWNRASLWAAGLTLATVVSPVGWSYYYIAPAAFLPLVIERFGWLRGLGIAIAIALPVSELVPWATRSAPALESRMELLGLVSVGLMALVFLGMSRGKQGSG